jgi:hypothetical protein
MPKRLLLSLIVIFPLVLGACGTLRVIEGSGDVLTETRAVSDFDRVILGGIGELTLIQGEEENLEIEAEDNILPQITTEVRDGTLTISFDDAEWEEFIQPNEPIRYTLRMIDVTGLTISGAATLEADALESSSLALGLSGGGAIRVNALTASEIAVDISGVGHIALAGQVGAQSIDLSGGGAYQAAHLESNRASVDVSGLGTATLWVNDTLDVVISGGGDVNYYGDPAVTSNISGLGGVDRLGDRP